MIDTESTGSGDRLNPLITGSSDTPEQPYSPIKNQGHKRDHKNNGDKYGDNKTMKVAKERTNSENR